VISKEMHGWVSHPCLAISEDIYPLLTNMKLKAQTFAFQGFHYELVQKKFYVQTESEHRIAFITLLFANNFLK
jgi:hypothetical protein